MIRLLAAPFPVVLFLAPLLVMPAAPIAAIGALGLLLATVSVLMAWRAGVTAAACVFLANYAMAVWTRGAPVGVVGAAGFGLALLGLLQVADLSGYGRRSTVEPAAVRAHLGRWLAVTAGALGAVALAAPLATALATALPSAVAPLLAAGAALGVVATVAALIAQAGKSRRGADR